MSHPQKPSSSYRLDFICNRDPYPEPLVETTLTSQPLPSNHTDTISPSFSATLNPPVSSQSTSGINFPSNFSESSTNTCFCCGSVHYVYSNNFDTRSPQCFSLSQGPLSNETFPPFSTPFSSNAQYRPLNTTAGFSVQPGSTKAEPSSDNQISAYYESRSIPLQTTNSLETPPSQSLYQKPSYSQTNQQNAPELTQTDHSSPKSDVSGSSDEKDENIRCLWATCSAEFSTADDLIPHLSNNHLSGREKDSRCKWEYCQDYQGGTDELLKHLNDVHLGLEQVKLTCQWEDCHSQYTSFDDLTEHLSEKHVGSGRSFYVCGWSRCQRDGRPFVQRQKVMRHLQSHTGDKPYMCMVCEKRFAQSTVMSQHLRTHTGEKPYQCPISDCGKKFSIPGSLTGHLRSHKGEKPYACKFSGCNRQFGNSSNLSKHVRTHTGERPFRCFNNPPCPKRFARPDQAARHMKIHTNHRSPSQTSEPHSGSRP